MALAASSRPFPSPSPELDAGHQPGDGQEGAAPGRSSIVFASSWPTPKAPLVAPAAREGSPQSGVLTRSVVVSPTPRSLEPIEPQPSIIIAPLDAPPAAARPPPPPPPRETPPPVVVAPPTIRPVVSAVMAAVEALVPLPAGPGVELPWVQAPEPSAREGSEPSSSPTAPELPMASADTVAKRRKTLASGLRPAQPRAVPAERGSPRGAARPADTLPEVEVVPAEPPAGKAARPVAPEPVAAVSDSRIVHAGKANRKVLDALSQVKRRDVSSEPARPALESSETPADRLAAGSLQVALRMEQGGRLDDAIRYLEKSIAQSPDAPSLYNRLAIILMRERADLRRAEQLLQKAVALAPDDGVYSMNLKAVVTRRALKP